MKDHRRMLAALLSAALMAGALAGCTEKTGGEGTSSPIPSGSEAPSASPSPSTSPSASPVPAGSEVPLVDTEDVTMKVLGYPRTTTMLTVDGAEVNAEELLYWLGYITENYAYYQYGSPEEMNWEEPINGQTAVEYMKNGARDMAILYQVVQNRAAELGVEPTAEQKADLNSQIADTINGMGGTVAYALALNDINRSDAGLRNMALVNSVLYPGIQEALFGVGEISDADVLSWAAENGKMQVKHILIKTVDDGGTSLSEEEIAAAKTKAEGLLEQLKAAEDPVALFDELMNENSEDGRDASGNLYAPDGYFFGEGEMVKEFEAASQALGENELSDLVESFYGYHIILRLPIDPELAREAWKESEAAAAESRMQEQVNTWVQEAKVETSKEYDELDPKAYYEGLTAYREENTPSTGDGENPS